MFIPPCHNAAYNALSRWRERILQSDALVAGVGRVPRTIPDPLEGHVLLGPADEVDGAFLAAPIPVIQIDPGLVIDDQDARPFRHILAEPLWLDPLEGALSCS